MLKDWLSKTLATFRHIAKIRVAIVVKTRFPVPSLCTYVKAMISVAKC